MIVSLSRILKLNFPSETSYMVVFIIENLAFINVIGDKILIERLLIDFAIMSCGIIGWTLDIIIRLAGLIRRYFRVINCNVRLFYDYLLNGVFACKVYAEPVFCDAWCEFGVVSSLNALKVYYDCGEP